MMKQGVLPSQAIRELIKAGNIIGGSNENVQPASLDLTVGDEIYRLPAVFLPKPGEKVLDVAKSIGAEPYSFDYPLERNTPYLIKLKESLKLPEGVYAYTNPKSSIGRTGFHVALIADGVPRFDSAGVKGYEGDLWIIARPEIFRIKISPGVALTQVRFFYSDTRMQQSEMESFYSEYDALYVGDEPLPLNGIKISDRDGGLILTADLGSFDIVGWRSEGSQKVLDLSQRNFYDPANFFTPVQKPKSGYVILRRGDFYIFVTKEKIRVPPNFVAEIMPVDVRSGEYRSHYAGFFDPGFGYGEKGEIKGTPAVLEVRSFEDDLALRDGQPVAKFVFERVAEHPDKVYGVGIGSHYQGQTGPRLSKHFRQI
jgi:dCTP deaminase